MRDQGSYMLAWPDLETYLMQSTKMTWVVVRTAGAGLESSKTAEVRDFKDRFHFAGALALQAYSSLAQFRIRVMFYAEGM